MIWLLIYISYPFWGGVPERTVLAEYHSKEECEAKASDLMLRRSVNMEYICGEKP